jgi:TonB family protein
MKRVLILAFLSTACGPRDAAAPAPATPSAPPPAPAPAVAATVDAGAVATAPVAALVVAAPIEISGPVATGGVSVPAVDSIMPKEPPEDDPTTLARDHVMQKISHLYMSGLQRCYQDRLKQQPTARGRVVLTFTVDEKGGVINPTATGIDDVLDACLVKRMSSWRFDPPRDKDGKPTTADFSLPLVYTST